MSKNKSKPVSSIQFAAFTEMIIFQPLVQGDRCFKIYHK